MMHEYDFNLQLDGGQVFELLDELCPTSSETTRVHNLRTIRGGIGSIIHVRCDYDINPALIEFYLRNWSKS